MTEGTADGTQKPLTLHSPVQLQERSGGRRKSSGFKLSGGLCQSGWYPSLISWGATIISSYIGSPKPAAGRAKTTLPPSAQIRLKQL